MSSKYQKDIDEIKKTANQWQSILLKKMKTKCPELIPIAKYIFLRYWVIEELREERMISKEFIDEESRKLEADL